MSTIKIDGWKEVENKLAVRRFSEINFASTIARDIQPYFLENTLASPGDTLEFMTGTWSGGIEPVTYMYRHKLFFPEENDGNGQWQVQGSFIDQPNESVLRTITLPADTTATKVHIESRALDENGSKYNNGNYLDITQPDVVPEPDPENQVGRFIFVEPEYKGYSWKVDRWWHNGDIKYETCSRVDYGDDQFYIDGTSPAMAVTIEYYNGQLLFSDYKDIRRILVCKSLLAVTRKETTEYIDIDFSVRDGYVVRYNGYPETPEGEPDPPEIFDPWKKENSPWIVSASLPIYAGKLVNGFTGKYTGGDPAEDDLWKERIRLQARRSPSDPFSEFVTSWVDLEVRGGNEPITFEIPEEVPIGAQVRLQMQHRLKVPDENGEVYNINSVSTTYDVVEQIVVTDSGEWSASGSDFKVGNQIKMIPVNFSRGAATAVLQIMRIGTPYWQPAPGFKPRDYNTDRNLPDIYYTFTETGFYRLLCSVTVDGQTAERSLATRRVY